jgi:hypothetical protein
VEYLKKKENRRNDKELAKVRLDLARIGQDNITDESNFRGA